MMMSKPGPETCPCGEVCDSWIYDEQDQEWEPDFEWWSHKASGHGFLCSRRCWLDAHRASCGTGNGCIGMAVM